MTNEVKVLTVKEAIDYAIDNGIEQAKKQLNYWNKYGRLVKNNAKSLERSLLQLHETVEITGGGKRGKVYLGEKHSEIKGIKCDLFDRLEKDKSFRYELHEHFQTKRVTRKMFYAYYFGYDDVYFDRNGNRLESTKYRPNQNKKKKEELYWHKYYVYRFIVDNKVTYVGLTGHLSYRMHGHKFNGHLKQELYDSVDRIEYIELETEVDMNIAAIYFIAKFQPAWNSSRTYDRKLGIAIEELDNLEWKTYDFSLKNVI